MFKFTVRESNGWTFSTTDVRKMYIFMVNRGQFNCEFSIEISKDNEYLFSDAPLAITDEFIDYFYGSNVKSSHYKVGGELLVGKPDKVEHIEWLDGFFNELVKSIIFSYSPLILETIQNSKVHFELIHDKTASTKWEFIISEGDKVLFDSRKCSNILNAPHDIFMCMVLFSSASDQPIIISPENETLSGFDI